jgi:hypothetical protein
MFFRKAAARVAQISVLSGFELFVNFSNHNKTHQQLKKKMQATKIKTTKKWSEIADIIMVFSPIFDRKWFFTNCNGRTSLFHQFLTQDCKDFHGFWHWIAISDFFQWFITLIDFLLFGPFETFLLFPVYNTGMFRFEDLSIALVLFFAGFKSFGRNLEIWIGVVMWQLTSDKLGVRA